MPTITLPMRPRKVRSLLALAGTAAITAGMFLGAGTARADLSDAEFAYVVTWGPLAICPVLDEYPTKAGVFGVVEGIHDDGFSYPDSVEIINAAVEAFCDRHWNLLVRIGNEARSTGRVAA